MIFCYSKLAYIALAITLLAICIISPNRNSESPDEIDDPSQSKNDNHHTLQESLLDFTASNDY